MKVKIVRIVSYVRQIRWVRQSWTNDLGRNFTHQLQQPTRWSQFSRTSTVCVSVWFECYPKCYWVTHLKMLSQGSLIFTKLSSIIKICLLSLCATHRGIGFLWNKWRSKCRRIRMMTSWRQKNLIYHWVSIET